MRSNDHPYLINRVTAFIIFMLKESKCTLPDGSPIPCMLLANKCDAPAREVEQMEIEDFYKENNFIGWTETSAKSGIMVHDSMRWVAKFGDYPSFFVPV